MLHFNVPKGEAPKVTYCRGTITYVPKEYMDTYVQEDKYRDIYYSCAGYGTGYTSRNANIYADRPY